MSLFLTGFYKTRRHFVFASEFKIVVQRRPSYIQIVEIHLSFAQSPSVPRSIFKFKAPSSILLTDNLSPNPRL